MHVIERTGARDIDKHQSAEVQDKPVRVPGCHRQQPVGQDGRRGDVQFADAVTVATTPSRLTSICSGDSCPCSIVLTPSGTMAGR